VSGPSLGENGGSGFSKGGAADLVSKGGGCRRKGFRFFLLFPPNFLRPQNVLPHFLPPPMLVKFFPPSSIPL